MSAVATASIDLSPTLDVPNLIMASDDGAQANQTFVGEEEELFASLSTEEAAEARAWVEAEFSKYYIALDGNVRDALTEVELRDRWHSSNKISKLKDFTTRVKMRLSLQHFPLQSQQMVGQWQNSCIRS